MTFKGMLKILINDYRKQHEEKMYSVVQELMKTRRELREVKEQLRVLQTTNAIVTYDDGKRPPVTTINLFVQYNGFFNQLCEIRQTTTVGELLAKLRQLTGIPFDHLIRIRVLDDDGLTTLFFLRKESDRTLNSYGNCLKDRMILSIEDDDIVDSGQEKRLQRSKSINNREKTYSFDESDV